MGRFVLPVLVLIFVSLKNTSTEDFTIQTFSTVSSEQFASAMFGFLTYRIPLFTRQLTQSIDISMLLPGSAAIAYQATMDIKKNDNKVQEQQQKQQRTIFLISGPSYTGKTTLVNKLKKMIIVL